MSKKSVSVGIGANDMINQLQTMFAQYYSYHQSEFMKQVWQKRKTKHEIGKEVITNGD